MRLCLCGIKLGPNNQSGICKACKRRCECGRSKEPNVEHCAVCNSKACVSCGVLIPPSVQSVDSLCKKCLPKFVPCVVCKKELKRYAKSCRYCLEADRVASNAESLKNPPSVGRITACSKCRLPRPVGAPCKPCMAAYQNERNRLYPTRVCESCGTTHPRPKKCPTCFPGYHREQTNARRRRLRESLGKYVPNRPLCKTCGLKPVPNAKRLNCDDCKVNAGPKPSTGTTPCSSCGEERRVGKKCRRCTRNRLRSATYIASEELIRAQSRRCVTCQITLQDRCVRYCNDCMQRRKFIASRTYRIENIEAVRRNKTHAAGLRRVRGLNAYGEYSEAEWNAIVVKQEGRCAHCYVVSEQLQRDHVMPLSCGGTNFAFNIQGLCAPCNRAKSDIVPQFMQLSIWDRIDMLRQSRRANPKTRYVARINRAAGKW